MILGNIYFILFVKKYQNLSNSVNIFLKFSFIYGRIYLAKKINSKKAEIPFYDPYC